MTKRSTRPKCTAKTAKGKRCKNSAMDGTDPLVCQSHIAGMVGRKTKLEPAVADLIIDLLKAGNYVEVACAAAGVAKATFYEWLDRGDPDGTAKADKPFRDFRERVANARAEGEARNVAIIATAAKDDWKAAAWMLERQFPDRWARPNQRPTDKRSSQAVAGPAVTAPAAEQEEGGDDPGGAKVTPLDAIRRRAAAAATG